jgi:hypothetical protein
MESWSPDLRGIEQCYESGATFSAISIRQHRRAENRTPFTLATAIMQAPEKYPGALIRMAEERCRIQVAKAIIPVAQVATNEKWFG